MLREQLRLRNQHIQQQRQELSDEKVPGHLDELGQESCPQFEYTGKRDAAGMSSLVYRIN